MSERKEYEIVTTLRNRVAELEKERDSIAAQNVALRSAVTEVGIALAVITKVYWDKFCPETRTQVDESFKLMNSALNLPNLAESILKRRDAATLRRTAERFDYTTYTGSMGEVLRMWAAEIEGAEK